MHSPSSSDLTLEWRILVRIGRLSPMFGFLSKLRYCQWCPRLRELCVSSVIWITRPDGGRQLCWTSVTSDDTNFWRQPQSQISGEGYVCRLEVVNDLARSSCSWHAPANSFSANVREIRSEKTHALQNTGSPVNHSQTPVRRIFSGEKPSIRISTNVSTYPLRLHTQAAFATQ